MVRAVVSHSRSVAGKIVLPFFFSTLFILDVQGDLIIRQVPTNGDQSWNVRGLATYEYEGSNPRTYNFHCTSTINDGNQVIWRRKDGVSLTKTQTGITNGVSMLFTSPVAGDAGLYACVDDQSNEEVEITITSKNPAAAAVTSSLTRYPGENVVINMYASALAPIENNQIQWRLNGVAITDGTFTNDKTSLVINNISPSDAASAGVYQMIVTIGNQMTANSSTTLIVLEPPVVIAHPLNVQNVPEWSSIELHCNASGSGQLSVEWLREGGNLPSTQSVQTETVGSVVVSTLTITNLRVADSGSYYCNVSTSDGERYNVSKSAQVTVTVNTRLSFFPSGESNSEIVSDILYIPSSSLPSHVDCEGSGTKYWKGPANINVSVDTDDNPHQHFITDTGYQRLNFSSFFSASNVGSYTCVSEGSTSSIYITNSNPAVYTAFSEITVGNFTDIKIQVYVDGDPKPSSHNITWFFNGDQLPDKPYYSLENGNKDLVIRGYSNLTVGRYECRVSTSIGDNSVFVNVSYFDPPIVTVSPKVVTVGEGDTASFNCSASSVVDTVINWYKDGTDPSALTSDNGVLVITNVTRSDTGAYYCEAVDSEGIWIIRGERVQLFVEYGPTTYVGEFTTNRSMSLTITLEELESSPVYFCSADGYPQPSLSWRFNGGNLPGGINTSLASDRVHAQLIWSRKILYSDNGTFSCHASNEIGSSSSNLFLTVYATPTVYTIHPSTDDATPPVSLISVSPLTFSVPATFSGGSVLKCVARGFPVPHIRWVDSNGTSLTPMFVSRPFGMVEAILEWDSALLSGPVRCEVSNEFGNDSKSVNFAEGTVRITNTTITDPPATKSAITVRVKVDSTQCSAAFLSMIQDSLIKTTRLAILSQCGQSCDYDSLDVTNSSSGCGTDNVTPIFLITIRTSDPEQTIEAYRSLGKWIITNPAFFSNNRTYQVDSNCAFLVEDTANSLSCDTPTDTPPTSTAQPTSTTTPTSRPESIPFMEVWISIVAMIVFLLVVVAVALIVVLCLCIKSISQYNKDNGQRKSKAAEAWPDTDGNSIPLTDYHRTQTRSQENLNTSFCTPVTDHELKQSTHTEDSTSGRMLDNQMYAMAPEIEQIRKMESGRSSQRVISTSFANENTDLPSPSGRGASSISPIVSSESLQSTVINEKLYQPLSSNHLQCEDPMYDQIRVTAVQKEHEGRSHASPTSGSMSHQSGVGNHSERTLEPLTNQRRNTVPPRLPPISSNTKPPVHYTEPHSHTSTPIGTRSMTSSPALYPPRPYCEPVSSMGSLRTVGIIHDTDSTKNTRTISSPTVGEQLPDPPPCSVDEGGSSQHWYTSGDSDIVTPTSRMTYSNDTTIEPYASTPSSLIKASPYSQPSTDWQGMVDSNSPVSSSQQEKYTAYETVNV